MKGTRKVKPVKPWGAWGLGWYRLGRRRLEISSVPAKLSKSRDLKTCLSPQIPYLELGRLGFVSRSRVSRLMSLSIHTTSSGQSSCFSILYYWQFKFLCSIHRVSTTVDTLSSSFFHVRGRKLFNLICNNCQWNVSREQPNLSTQSIATDQWIRLILTYARHRRLFILRVEDAETAESDWVEILRNERINRE